MAWIVLALLGLAGLLRLEQQGVARALSAQKARLNAQMAGRIALAHLQQEAGPDRRATATGDLAGLIPSALPSPYDSTTALDRRVGQGQARWTGVWRTDQPDQPPAWLVSGKGAPTPGEIGQIPLAQSVSLAGTDDYPETYWAPWQTDYPPPRSIPLLLLIGEGSATAEGRIALPRLVFPEAASNRAPAGFAYWVGDEGIKARTDLVDPRDLSAPTPGNADAVAALRCPGRLGNPSTESSPADDRARRSTFHDTTLFAAGVLADSYRGGLRRDLSLAFEMEDRDFDVSEFGNGLGEPVGIAAATELYTTTLHPVTGAPQPRASWFPPFPGRVDGGVDKSDPRPRVWVPIWEGNPDNPGRDPTGAGPSCKAWSPVFLREDEMGRPLRDPSQPPDVNLEPPYSSPRRLVGPLWHLLRDHYRLYKDVHIEQGAPMLDARAFFPDTDALVRGGYRPSPASEPSNAYDLDRAYWSNGGIRPDRPDSEGDTPDPMGVINGTKRGHPQPRAVRAAVMPALHRLTLMLSLRPVPEGDGRSVRLRLLVTPILILHNPYDLRLRLRAGPPGEEPDARAAGCAASLGLTGLQNLKLLIRTHVDNLPERPMTEIRGARVDRTLGIRAATEAVDDENLNLLIPALTLEPGEFAVLSASEVTDTATWTQGPERTLRLSRGLFAAGGIEGDLLTHALTVTGNPNHATTPQASRFASGGTVETWIDTRDLYWRHTLRLRSWRGQARLGDTLVDSPWPAPLGTGLRSSRASRALMVNLGSFDSEAPRFFGDSGNAAAPVRVGPLTPAALVPTQPRLVVAVLDTRARVADTARTTSPDRSVLPWQVARDNPVPAPHPSWIMSNPLAQTSNSPGFVYADMPGSPKPVISSSIGSPCLRTQFFGGDELDLAGPTGSWQRLMGVVPAAGGATARTFGGYSHSNTGAPAQVAVEIPTLAPLSLGQFMHANVGIWPWLPFYTLGNSLAPVAIPKDKCWVHGIDPGRGSQPGGQTLPDIAYLMNQALWDGFYLSGAAPRVTLGCEGSYADRRLRTTEETLVGFAARENTLGNPRLRLHHPAGWPAAGAVFPQSGFARGDAGHAPDGHRRLAGYLLADGALNVNSTSPAAWTALLSATGGISLGRDPPGMTGAPFARTVSASTEPATRDLHAPSYWTGFVRLNETQLRTLAEGIVEEVRARARFHRRTERDQESPPRSRRFRGFPLELEPGTPFLGLGEFVNRFLGPTRRAGAHIRSSLYSIRCDGAETADPPLDDMTTRYFWTLGSGTLESALGRADLRLGSQTISGLPAGASPLVAAISHRWGTDGGRTGMPPGYFFRNVELAAPGLSPAYAAGSPAENRAHNGMGAAGCLFQADLLQSLGSLLATRSDTFRIRAAADAEGTAATLELIVQRLPDYLDPRDAPWTRPDIPGLRPVNRLLGRRFRVVAARWLAPADL